MYRCRRPVHCLHCNHTSWVEGQPLVCLRQRPHRVLGEVLQLAYPCQRCLPCCVHCRPVRCCLWQQWLRPSNTWLLDCAKCLLLDMCHRPYESHRALCSLSKLTRLGRLCCLVKHCCVGSLGSLGSLGSVGSMCRLGRLGRVCSLHCLCNRCLCHRRRLRRLINFLGCNPRMRTVLFKVSWTGGT